MNIHSAITPVVAADRAVHELDADRRMVYHQRKAAAAGGVSQPDGEDHQSDQSGPQRRQAWDQSPERDPLPLPPPPPRQSKAPTPQSGTLLDLTG